MRGFKCDRCQTWFEDDKGATLHIHHHGSDRDGITLDPRILRCDKDGCNFHGKTVHLCSRCASFFQKWQINPKAEEKNCTEAAEKIRARLHKLWTASDGPGYVKKDWQEFEKMLAQAFTDMWPL